MTPIRALRTAANGLLLLGAALLIAALLLSTYTAGRIAKIPLDIDTTLVSSGTATALDPASLSTDRFVANNNVPVVQQQQYSTESGAQTPSNADVVSLQVGTTLRRTDKQQDTGLILAMVDTVTLNRRTAMAVSSDNNPAGSVQKPRTMDDTKPPTNIPLKHEGLNYRFPFDVEKKTYPYFDPIAQKTFDANYDGEEDVNGLTTFHFKQSVGLDTNGKLVEPVEYPSLYDRDEDAVVTARAALWGLPGAAPDEQVTMKRYYAADRDFWVDPVTGTIVKIKERAMHYYVRCGEPDCKTRDPLRPDVTLVDYTVTSNEATVEQQVNAARDERDRIAVWSRILPITFTALGIIALIAGVLMGLFTLRTETALIDPGLDTGDHFFGPRGPAGEPVPGAEAETEKLPTQRRPPPEAPRPGPPPP